MPEQPTLPPLCRDQLKALHADVQRAQDTLNKAGDVAIAAIGLDPRTKYNIDLDTGLVTVAEPPKEQG